MNLREHCITSVETLHKWQVAREPKGRDESRTDRVLNGYECAMADLHAEDLGPKKFKVLRRP